jgi:hypothetical protein
MTKTHRGSCHCGAVTFEVELDATTGGRCNCSICTKLGVTGSIVKPAAFTQRTGTDAVGIYEWGYKVSRRHFCRQCGVHCFAYGHLAELGGDYVSINLNCLDDIDVGEVKLSYWDGRHNNWEGGMRESPWPTA